jgi:hypothetical protein
MITEERSSLGCKIPFTRPATVDEYNESAKRTDGKNACLEDAVEFNYAHVWLSDFRELFLHGRDEVKDKDGNVVVSKIVGIDTLTGIPRQTKLITLKSKDKDGNFETREEWGESQGVYFERVLSTLGKEASAFQDHAIAVAKQIPFDAERDRTGWFRRSGPQDRSRSWEVHQRHWRQSERHRIARVVYQGVEGL